MEFGEYVCDEHLKDLIEAVPQMKDYIDSFLPPSTELRLL
jgi:hypothetical protein